MSSSPLPSSSDDGDARSHVKPNSTPPTKSSAASSDSEPKTPRRSLVMKKNSDRSRPDTRVGPKRSRDRPEAKLPASKKKKNSRKTGTSGSKSQIDIEELLAQTYPKEPSVLGDETRRANGLDEPSELAKDTAKKWSAEDEVSLANAVLAPSDADFNIGNVPRNPHGIPTRSGTFCSCPIPKTTLDLATNNVLDGIPTIS